MARKARDAFRTISEVADWLDVPAHVLRFWESKFRQIKPVKRAGGRRYYRPNDMLLIGGIKRLLHEDGHAIKEVQQILKSEGVKYVVGFSAPIEDHMETTQQPVAKAKPVDPKPVIEAKKPDAPPASPDPAIADAEIVGEAPYIHEETPDLFGGQNIVQMAPKPAEPAIRATKNTPASEALPLPLDLPPIPPKVKLPRALNLPKIKPTNAHKKRLSALQSIRALPYSAEIENQDDFRLSLAKLQSLRDRMADANG